MGTYLIRRFFLMLLTLFGISILVFTMLRVVPGNIADILFDSAGMIDTAEKAKLEKDLASPEVKATIEENFKLAEAMGMNGTPSYVIGKQVVIGAVGVDNLKEKIGVARCGKATC